MAFRHGRLSRLFVLELAEAKREDAVVRQAMVEHFPSQFGNPRQLRNTGEVSQRASDMTGGRVVVLGNTGINFAAGMSGGIAYVYDPNQRFDTLCNLEMVDLELVQDPLDITELKAMIVKHHRYTESQKADHILSDWENHLPYFIKVFPIEYRKVLGKMTKEDEATEGQEVWHG